MQGTLKHRISGPTIRKSEVAEAKKAIRVINYHDHSELQLHHEHPLPLTLAEMLRFRAELEVAIRRHTLGRTVTVVPDEQ